MNNGKKKSKGLASLLGQRKFRYGGYATILTVVVIAVVIIWVHYAAWSVPGQNNNCCCGNDCGDNCCCGNNNCGNNCCNPCFNNCCC